MSNHQPICLLYNFRYIFFKSQALQYKWHLKPILIIQPIYVFHDDSDSHLQGKMLSRVVTERGGIGLRRNGKEKACEPCRKGKLACDHTTPICNRCIRRKITAKCIYHPAPMTRPRDSQASTSPSINQHAPSFSLNASSQQSSPQQRISIHSQPPYSRSDPLSQGSGLPRDAQTNTTELNRPTNRIVASSPSYDWDHDTAFRRSVRYYGPTSFSAAFTEGAELSADLNIYENARKHPANW